MLWSALWKINWTNASSLSGNGDEPKKADHWYLLASSYEQHKLKAYNMFMRFSESYFLCRYTPVPINNGDRKYRGYVADMIACSLATLLRWISARRPGWDMIPSTRPWSVSGTAFCKAKRSREWGGTHHIHKAGSGSPFLSLCRYMCTLHWALCYTVTSNYFHFRQLNAAENTNRHTWELYIYIWIFV